MITITIYFTTSLQFLLALLAPLFLAVGLPIKVPKQEQEYRNVDHEEEGKRSGHAALEADDEKQVHEHDAKLRQLDRRHVLLPPEILVILWSHGRYQIIRVHDDVHERVQDSEKSSLDACRFGKA